MRRHTGFTLIEILVVIVIVSILVSVTIISFGDFGESRRERMVLDQFVDVIQSVQEKAVLQSTTLVMHVDANGYSINNEEHDNDGFRLFSSMKVDVKNEDQDIIFSPNGMVTPFVLTAQNKNHQWEVRVKPNGNAFLE